LTTRGADWQSWWEHNRDAYLAFVAPLHEAPPASTRTRPDSQQDKTRAQRTDREPSGQKLIDEKIIPALLSALGDSHHDVRASACLALGKTGRARLREAVAGRLLDRHAKVRETAALALGLLGAQDTLPVLFRVAVDRFRPGGRTIRMQLRARAFAAIGVGFHREEKTLDVLKEILLRKEGAHDVPAAALLSLGRVDGDEAPEALVRALSRRSPFPDMIRAYAAVALGKLGDPRTVPALFSALGDRSFHVQSSAALALGGFAPTAPPEERDIREMEKRLEGMDPARFSPRAREALIRRIASLTRSAARHRENREKIRASIIRRLYPVASGSSVPGDPTVRNFAAVSIGRLGGPEAENALAEILRRAKPVDLRCFACLGLGIAGRGRDGDRGRDLVLKTLRGAKNVNLRGACAIALGVLGDSTAGATLASRLKSSKDQEVRAHLALAVGMVGHRDSAPVLYRILKEEENVNLRRNAALGLGLMRDAKGIEILVGILRSSRGRLVQGSAALALGHIGDRRAVVPLIGLLENRRAPAQSRAFAAVALGILAEGRPVSLLAEFAANNNYLVPVASIQEAFDIL